MKTYPTPGDSRIDSRDVIDAVEELEEKRDALPDDVEIFWHDGERTSPDDCWADREGAPLPEGFYWWTCLPGCMPEGDPKGPYETEELAEEAVREDCGDQLDAEEAGELETLRALVAEAADYCEDWAHGVALIHEDAFEDAMKALVEDIGDLPKDLPPYLVIDWAATADKMRVDYTEVDFGGETYLVR